MPLPKLLESFPHLLPYANFVETATRLNVQDEAIVKLVEYVSAELPNWKRDKKRRYIKKNTAARLLHTLEFDPLNNNVYVHFKSKRIIGKGLFAKVSVTTIVQTGKILAQKTYWKKPQVILSHREAQRMKQEGERHLALVHCPNIVKVHRVMERELLLEHMTLGSLESLLSTLEEEKQTLAAESKAKVAEGAISGMQQLHRHGFVHRDIKVDNILLGDAEGFAVKLGDLGSGCFIHDFGDADIGNNFGRSPAMWRSWINQALHENLPEDDLWAMGILLYELEYGLDKNPFLGQLRQLHATCNRLAHCLKTKQSSDVLEKARVLAERAYDAFIEAVKAFQVNFTPKAATLDSQIKALLCLDPDIRRVISPKA